MPEDVFLDGCRLFGHGLERGAKGNRPWEPSCSSGPSLSRAAVLILTSRAPGWAPRSRWNHSAFACVGLAALRVRCGHLVSGCLSCWSRIHCGGPRSLVLLTINVPKCTSACLGTEGHVFVVCPALRSGAPGTAVGRACVRTRRCCSCPDVGVQLSLSPSSRRSLLVVAPCLALRGV